MGGGLIQLTNVGAQNVYLTGNPQITFFKIIYKRHTNFSMESIEQTREGTVGPGTNAIYKIGRDGDLVHDCFFEFGVSDINSSNTINNLGHAIIQDVSIEIGGQIIDRHFGSFLEIYSELTEEQHNFSNGSFTSNFQYMTCAGGYKYDSDTMNDIKSKRNYLYIPLRFWFCKDIGLALPLIALQYQEVFINFTFTNFGSINNTKVYGTTSIKQDTRLFANYIFLDTEERRRFAQVSHEYLIETVQTNEYETESKLFYKLNFNNPVKEIIWCSSDNKIDSWGKSGSFTDISVKNVEWHIEFNGTNRMNPRNIDYYTNVQPYLYHKNRGMILDTAKDSNAIAVYSFALKPEDHQPSGTCNFSRIDTGYLFSNVASGVGYIYIFAINYNILRVMSGTAGLAYSN